ncbi:MAG: DMT family transporter [Bdellovibrionota bacterium]
MTDTGKTSRAGIAALVAVQILFGINYIVSKVIVDVFPPLVWASLRLMAAAASLTLIAVLAKRKRPVGGWRHFFLPLIGFSLLGVIINQGSFLVGLHYTTATNSAVLNTLIPIFTLLFVTLRRLEPLTIKRLLGFVAAFTGVLVIRKVEEISFSDRTLIGDLLTVLNCFSFAIFLTVSKKFLMKQDPIWFTAWLFIYGAIGLTLAALPDYRTFHFPEMTPSMIGCLLFAVLGGTLLAYLLNLWALANTRTTQVALFIYLQPVVAALLAFFLYGELITPRTMLASFLIFSGLILGNSRNSRVILPARNS